MSGTYIEIPVISGGAGSGITTLNGLTATTQTFAVGTAGTNFAISSSSSTHTFNLPIASATNTGKLSNTDWSTFNNKQAALTIGNLTDAGTDGITVTSGTGAVIGSGTSISQHVADATHNGYLSSADWSTFSAGGNAITALTGDVTASGPGSSVSTIANSAVTNAKLANMANNTVKGNKSGGAAAPSDLALSDVAEVTSAVLTISNGSKSIVGASNLTIAVSQSTTSTAGYLSSADWNTFNGKQAALTIGNLTDAGTDGITVTGGTGSVIGSGTSISQHVADTTHNGYLSSTDWNTFNGKQSATLTSAHILVGNGSNVAIDVAASGDVTLANTGAFTVVTVGGQTSSAVATAATQVAAATASSVANTLVLRSANSNITVNSTNQAAATTATAAGTTTLTTASAPHQQFTGVTTQIVVLLDATTTVVGKEFTIFNRSTGIVTVNNNGGSLVSTVAPNSQRVFTLINNGTSNGVWDIGSVGFADISGSVSSSNGMLAQTAAGTYTGRTITGTAGDIVVTNGDGIAGNPTLDIGTSVVTLTGSQSLSNKTIAASTLSGTMAASNNSITGLKNALFNGEIDDGSSSTAATIDWTTGNAHKILMTGNCTFTFTAPSGPGRLQIKLTQDGTGSRTATWPAAVKWPTAAPILTSTINAVDIAVFWYDGTNYYGTLTQNFV